MTLAEMAKKLGLKDTSTLRGMIALGRLKAEKVGKTYLVTDEEMERYRREHLGRQGRPRKDGPRET